MTKLFQKYKPIIMRCLCSIVSISIIAGAGVYVLMSKKQTYTASTNIKFTNSDASNGYAYDGSLIKSDIEEITGTEVLDAAIQQCGLEKEVTPNALAKQLTVEEVIPEDEQKKIDSALDNGKEYEYNPVEYKISINSDMPEAGKILNAVANSYMNYYAQNHIAKDTFPSDISTVISSDSTYDYIEIADMIRDNVEKMQSYLETESEKDPDYHNSESGYSFGDIKGKYDYLYNSKIPELYATILSNKATKNPDLLLKKLSQNNDTLTDNTNDTSEDLKNLESMIKSYSEKNKANGSVQSGEKGDSYDSNHTNVIEDVYTNESNPKSTYDELFTKYISETDSASMNSTDITYNEYLKTVFKGATATSDNEIKEDITEGINELILQLHELYEAASQIRSEHSEIEAAGVIMQINTPISARTVNVKLYTLLGTAAVFIMLCVAVPVVMIFKKNVEKYIAEIK